MTNFFAHIKDNALRYPHKTAIVSGDEKCSWEELYQQVEMRAKELKAASYKNGQVVCMRAMPTIDYLVDYFAFHLVGCVVAPLERDMPDEKFYQTRQWLEPQQVGKGASDILYTTGTTGQSKGVIISHQAILADAENLIESQGFSHETVFVINGPLNHIGSLSKIYPIILQGGTIIIVDGLKNLDVFFNAFDYPSDKMATFLVPASIRILIQLGAAWLTKIAHKIDFIETGAAAIAQADMQKLCQLLPHTRLYNTYASTETGIVCTHNFNSSLCEAGCLGKPMKHAEVFITDEGKIACRGKQIMTGYVGDPKRTAQILRNHTIYTADIGTIDEEGRLHLKGREDDVINVGGFKVSPLEVENATLSLPMVKDCICTSMPHPITGQALKLLIVTENNQILDKKAIATHLLTKLEPYKVPQFYEQTDKIKRTFNGKADRKHYRIES